MNKYIVFSIDDGTIYDKKVIDIFNKYHIRATFNLNSGLQEFVWYKEDKPVQRLDLYNNKDLYKGHEIASHSLTHPYLTMCPDDIVYKEVKEDIENLETIFGREITTFAFPFEDFDDRTISIIKHFPSISLIRVSAIDQSFKMPVDPFRVKITSWNINEALELFDIFLKEEKAKLFFFVAHSYDFEFDNNYDLLEELCQKVVDNNVYPITCKELASLIKKGEL